MGGIRSRWQDVRTHELEGRRRAQCRRGREYRVRSTERRSGSRAIARKGRADKTGTTLDTRLPPRGHSRLRRQRPHATSGNANLVGLVAHILPAVHKPDGSLEIESRVGSCIVHQQALETSWPPNGKTINTSTELGARDHLLEPALYSCGIPRRGRVYSLSLPNSGNPAYPCKPCLVLFNVADLPTLSMTAS